MLRDSNHIITLIEKYYEDVTVVFVANLFISVKVSNVQVYVPCIKHVCVQIWSCHPHTNTVYLLEWKWEWWWVL